MRQPSSRWIRTDSGSDLLNSLEHCLLTFTLTRSDLRNWKWCVATAHSAAQIAMVIVLDAQGGYKHLHRESRAKFIAWLNTEGERAPRPELSLNTFDYLVKSVWPLLAPETAKPELRHDLESLWLLRDGWTHFGLSGDSVAIGHARHAVQAGIKLVSVLPLPPLNNLYRSMAEETRHVVAVSALLRLLAVAELEAVRRRAR
jgi:hypothetical protein